MDEEISSADEDFQFFLEGFGSTEDVSLVASPPQVEAPQEKLPRKRKREEVAIETKQSWNVLLPVCERENLVKTKRFVGIIKIKESIYALALPMNIAGYLLPHQRNAVILVWNACFGTRSSKNSPCPEEARTAYTTLEGFSAKSGAILAHQMGTGKTFTAITILVLFHLAVREYNYISCNTLGAFISHSLVVVPTTLIPTWQMEWKRWVVNTGISEALQGTEKRSQDEATRHYGGLYTRAAVERWGRCGGVLLSSYSGTLYELKAAEKENTAHIGADLLKKLPNICIFDEGHERLTGGTITRGYLSKLPCLGKVVMSGTPLSNNIDEYFNLISFVRDGFFTPEYTAQLKTYLIVQPKYRTEHSALASRQVAYLLNALLRDFVDRQKCQQVMSTLGTLKEYVVRVPLGVKQFRSYGRVKDLATDERRVTYFTLFHLLMRITHHPDLALVKTPETTAEDDDDETSEPEQEDEEHPNRGLETSHLDNLKEQLSEIPAAADPDPLTDSLWGDGLLDKARENNFDSAKAEVAARLIKHHHSKGEKTLVFSVYIDTLEWFAGFLNTRHPEISTACAHSRVNKSKVLKDFTRNDTTDVLLVTLATGSVGLNLQNASTVIFLDTPWNPSKISQAICRSHRVGQTRDVTSYRLVTRGTLEDKVSNVALTKELITRQVVDGASETAKDFTQRLGMPFSDLLDLRTINSAPTQEERVKTESVCAASEALNSIRQYMVCCAEQKDFFGDAKTLTTEEKRHILENKEFKRVGAPYGSRRLIPLSFIDEEEAEQAQEEQKQKQEQGKEESPKVEVREAVVPPPVVDPVVSVQKVESKVRPQVTVPIPLSLAASKPPPSKNRPPPVLVRRAVPKAATYNGTAVIRVYSKAELAAIDEMLVLEQVASDLDLARKKFQKKHKEPFIA